MSNRFRNLKDKEKRFQTPYLEYSLNMPELVEISEINKRYENTNDSYKMNSPELIKSDNRMNKNDDKSDIKSKGKNTLWSIESENSSGANESSKGLSKNEDKNFKSKFKEYFLTCIPKKK